MAGLIRISSVRTDCPTPKKPLTQLDFPKRLHPAWVGNLKINEKYFDSGKICGLITIQ
jgi:hypothetical protein